MTETEAVAETALLTRKFARRQVGWFGRNPQIRWFDASAGIVACSNWVAQLEF
jgi:tRNA dimethylallyltransferase